MRAVLAFALLALVGPASADDSNQPARSNKAFDRAAVSSAILSRWAGSSADGGAELGVALQSAKPEALAAAAQAETPAALQSALSGRSIDPNTLGDPDSDLVLFPLTPCRLVDTRFGGGILAANTSRDFETQGNLSAQGGNAAGCAVPGTDPAALAVTITAVNPQGAGNLRAYGAGAALPNASVVNYALPGQGLNLANTTILPITQDVLNPNEFAIRADVAATHVVVDVVGYFDRAGLNFPAGFDDSLVVNMASGINYLISATNIAPTRTLTCLVTAEGAWFQSGGVPASGFGQIRTALRNVTTATNTNEGGWNNYMGALGDNMGTGSKTAVWTLAPGSTYQFGCSASASGDFIGDFVYCTVSWFCR